MLDDGSVASSLEGSLEASVEGSTASADGLGSGLGQGAAQGQGLSSSQRRESQLGEGGLGGVEGDDQGLGQTDNDGAGEGGGMEGQEEGGENEDHDNYQQLMASEKGMGGGGTGKRVRYDSVQMRAQQEEEVVVIVVIVVHPIDIHFINTPVTSTLINTP